MSILCMLPMLVTIRIGVNEAMIAMFEGLMGALQINPPVKSNLRTRRKFVQGGLHLARLDLAANVHPTSHEGADREEPEQLYEDIISFLAGYKALDVGFKPRGQRFGTVAFEKIHHGYIQVCMITDRLFELVDVLWIYGLVWDPVVVRRQNDEGAQAESRRRLLELGYTAEEVDSAS